MRYFCEFDIEDYFLSILIYKFGIKIHSSSKTSKEDLLYFCIHNTQNQNAIYSVKQEKFKNSIVGR